jgi:hypothetical protein
MKWMHAVFSKHGYAPRTKNYLFLKRTVWFSRLKHCMCWARWFRIFVLLLIQSHSIKMHYGTQTRCRRPVAVGTAKNAVGTVCADGHRRHIAVGLGGRRHRPYCRRHRFSRRPIAMPTAIMSRRHNNAVGTGNFSYFFKKMNFWKNQKKNYFYFILIFLFSLIFFFFFEFLLFLWIFLKSL